MTGVLPTAAITETRPTHLPARRATAAAEAAEPAGAAQAVAAEPAEAEARPAEEEDKTTIKTDIQ